MIRSSEFPNDVNGDVLRRMYAGGDDLTQPRMVDFNFIFADRRQALSFAEIIGDLDKKVCIAYFGEKKMWDVTVKHCMVPDHKRITDMECTLAAKAESVGGKADGWNCLRMPQKKT